MATEWVVDDINEGGNVVSWPGSILANDGNGFPMSTWNTGETISRIRLGGQLSFSLDNFNAMSVSVNDGFFAQGHNVFEVWADKNGATPSGPPGVGSLNPAVMLHDVMQLDFLESFHSADGDDHYNAVYKFAGGLRDVDSSRGPLVGATSAVYLTWTLGNPGLFVPTGTPAGVVGFWDVYLWWEILFVHV